MTQNQKACLRNASRDLVRYSIVASNIKANPEDSQAVILKAMAMKKIAKLIARIEAILMSEAVDGKPSIRAKRTLQEAKELILHTLGFKGVANATNFVVC